MLYRFLQSVYYIINIITGIALPQTRITSIAMFYLVIVFSTYCLFQLDMVESIGPWFVNEEELQKKYNQGDQQDKQQDTVFTQPEVQSIVAIDCVTLMLIVVPYLLRNLFFAVPQCDNIGKLYNDLSSKLFWDNYPIQHIIGSILCMIIMYPLFRYCIGKILENDDQYCKRLETFIEKFYIQLVVLVLVLVLVFWLSRLAYRRYRHREKFKPIVTNNTLSQQSIPSIQPSAPPPPLPTAATPNSL